MTLRISVGELADELAERLNAQWSAKLRAFERRVAALEAEATAAWEDGDRRVRDMLNSNPRYRRTVDAFLNLRGYAKDWRGWEAACRCEPGLWKRTGNLARASWPRFWRVLLESRKERGRDDGAGR